jgi:hypothetical protein
MGDDLKMLEWLKEKGALSHEASEISINTYQEEIVKTFQVSPDVARNWYRKHVKRRWIEGKQGGAHVTEVWLTFNLDEDEGGKVCSTGREAASSVPEMKERRSLS